jgi:hypothetical protein
MNALSEQPAAAPAAHAFSARARARTLSTLTPSPFRYACAASTHAATSPRSHAAMGPDGPLAAARGPQAARNTSQYAFMAGILADIDAVRHPRYLILTMSDKAKYLRELAIAYQAGVLAETTYAILSRIKVRKADRQKFQALRALERKLLDRLREALTREGRTPRDSVLARLAGGSAAVAAVPLPWRWELKVLDAVQALTSPTVERVQKDIARHDPELGEALARHEEAQREFVRRELAGDARSLEAVTTLL